MNGRRSKNRSLRTFGVRYTCFIVTQCSSTGRISYLNYFEIEFLWKYLRFTQMTIFLTTKQVQNIFVSPEKYLLGKNEFTWLKYNHIALILYFCNIYSAYRVLLIFWPEKEGHFRKVCYWYQHFFFLLNNFYGIRNDLT